MPVPIQEDEERGAVGSTLSGSLLLWQWLCGYRLNARNSRGGEHVKDFREKAETGKEVRKEMACYLV